MSEYRHEYKYICSEQQLALIQNNIKGLMECDAHAGEDCQYRIRSLYFDDYCDSCMKDNINGNDPRESSGFGFMIKTCRISASSSREKSGERPKRLPV